MFSVCDVLLVNKIDAMSIFDFDIQTMEQRVRALNPEITIIPVSCKTGEGIESWINWIRNEIKGIH